MSEPVFRVGDLVCKPKGYPFNGTIVSVYNALNGQPKVVVEHGDGWQHIFAPEQLALRGEDETNVAVRSKSTAPYFKPGDAGRSE